MTLLSPALAGKLMRCSSLHTKLVQQHTSTINDLRVQIWNGAPNAGGTVIWGDLTTNRMTSTSWTNIYRAS